MSNTRTITFLSLNFSRLDPRIFYRLGISLVNRGFSVNYLVCDGGKPEILNGVHIWGLKRRYKSNLVAAFACQFNLYRSALRCQSDIIHVSEPYLIPLGIIMKLHGLTVLFDLREDYIGEIHNRSFIPAFAQALMSWVMKNVMKMSFTFFDIVVVPDAKLIGLHNLFLPKVNTVIVSNFPVYRHDFELERDEYTNRRPSILYLGSVYRISRQEIILDLVSERSDVDYIIFGKVWEEEYRQSLISLHDLESYFIDGSDRARIPELMKRSTIGNSIRDFAGSNFPEGSYGVIKIYEYMEAGMPVICSRVGIWEKMMMDYP